MSEHQPDNDADKRRRVEEADRFIESCKQFRGHPARDEAVLCAALALSRAQSWVQIERQQRKATEDRLLEFIAEQDTRIAALEAALRVQSERASRPPLALLPAPKAAA